MATGLVLEWQEQLPLLGWSGVVMGMLGVGVRKPVAPTLLPAPPVGRAGWSWPARGTWLRETLELRTEITSLGFFKACWTRA